MGFNIYLPQNLEKVKTNMKLKIYFNTGTKWVKLLATLKSEVIAH